VSPAELLSPHTRVSVQQTLIACGNAIRLSQDPSLAFRAGASMHVSTPTFVCAAMARLSGSVSEIWSSPVRSSWAVSEFDFVGICEAPDDAVMARYVL
jgi:hypothetical protein